MIARANGAAAGGVLACVALVACAKQEPPPSARTRLEPSAVAPQAAADAASPVATADAAPSGIASIGKDERLFRGSVGGKLPIVMRLTRNGSFLQGRYFYESERGAADLALLGAVTKDGVVALTETAIVGAAKSTTGSFQGAFAADGAFTGVWTDAGKTKSLPFAVSPVTPTLAPSAVTLFKKKVTYAAKATNGAGECTIAVSYPEVVGALDPKVELAVNKRLRPVGVDPPATCTEPSSMHGDYRVAINRAGVLSVVFEASDFAGGAYPNNSMAFVTVEIPSGRELVLKGILKPAGKAAVAAALEPAIAKASGDSEQAALLRPQLAVESADFAVEDGGLRLYAFNALPHAAQGLSAEGFLAPYAAIKDTLVPGTPVAAIAANSK